MITGTTAATARLSGWNGFPQPEHSLQQESQREEAGYGNHYFLPVKLHGLQTV
jgi:hypothetical protein